MHENANSGSACREFSNLEESVDVASRDVKSLGSIAGLRIGSDQLFLQTTERTRMALCISDPHEPNCPIVHANSVFSELTGYALDEIVGQNCRILQGPKTAP